MEYAVTEKEKKSPKRFHSFITQARSTQAAAGVTLQGWSKAQGRDPEVPGPRKQWPDRTLWTQSWSRQQLSDQEARTVLTRELTARQQEETHPLRAMRGQNQKMPMAGADVHKHRLGPENFLGPPRLH